MKNEGARLKNSSLFILLCSLALLVGLGCSALRLPHRISTGWGTPADSPIAGLPDPGQPGPYAVGVTRWTFTRPSTNHRPAPRPERVDLVPGVSRRDCLASCRPAPRSAARRGAGQARPTVSCGRILAWQRRLAAGLYVFRDPPCEPRLRHGRTAPSGQHISRLPFPVSTFGPGSPPVDSGLGPQSTGRRGVRARAGGQPEREWRSNSGGTTRRGPERRGWALVWRLDHLASGGPRSPLPGGRSDGDGAEARHGSSRAEHRSARDVDGRRA